MESYPHAQVGRTSNGGAIDLDVLPERPMTPHGSVAPLVDGVRQGSYPAWTQICDELGPPVVSFMTLRGVVDPFSATGDVFIDLASKIQDLHGQDAALSSLVFSIAHSRLAIEQRYSRRRFQPRPADHATAHTSSLDKLFDALPTEQADVLGLRLVGGLDAEQTAMILRRTESEVVSAEAQGMLELHRAVQHAGRDPFHSSEEPGCGEAESPHQGVIGLLTDGFTRPSDHFLLTCAARAAEEARALYEESQVSAEDDFSMTFSERLRRRATAFAATAAVVLGLSGMAWAADGAAPGDWYYGIDRALEAVGIGAGGAEERLLEVAASNGAVTEGSGSDQGPSETAVTRSSPGEITGTERAMEAVSARGAGSEQSLGTRDRVAGFLKFLTTFEGLSGQEIAEMAKSQSERPDNEHKPDQPGSPDNPGRAGGGRTGRP